MFKGQCLLVHVSTVNDLHDQGVLGDLAVGAPLHSAAGEAVHGEAGAGEHGNQGLAHLGVAHALGEVGLLAGLVQGVHTVIAVGGELVGLGAGGGLVLLNEALGRVAGGVKRGEDVHALGQAGVKALQGEDAVQAVAAEVGELIALLAGLNQDVGGGGVVDGQEDHLRAVVVGVGDLGGEVGGGVLGKGGGADDLQAQALSGLLEALVDAGGVVVAVVVDHGDLGGQLVLGDEVRGGLALVGVGEAHLEHVVVALGDGGGGGGGGELEHPVAVALGGHGGGGAGGGAPIEDLHLMVQQGVVGVDALLAVGLVILAVQLEADGVVQGVDLLDGDLGALVGGDAVLGVGAGQGADTADLDGDNVAAALAGLAGGIGGIAGVSALAGLAGGVGGIGSVRAAVGAAGQQAQAHGAGHEHGREIFLLHAWFLLKTM